MTIHVRTPEDGAAAPEVPEAGTAKDERGWALGMSATSLYCWGCRVYRLAFPCKGFRFTDLSYPNLLFQV
ncbi:hypothetical protein Bwad005_24600 [Bilophila wadsworthia]